MSVFLLLILGLVGSFVLVGVVVATVLLARQGSGSAAWIVPLLILPVVLIVGVGLVASLLLGWSTVRVEQPMRVESVTRSAPRPPHVPSVPDVVMASPAAETIEAEAPTAVAVAETTVNDAGDENPAQDARPDWIDAPPGRIASGDIYQMSVAVGPYLTRHECSRAMSGVLQGAVASYIAACFGPEAASRVRLPASYIDQYIVAEEFTETVDLEPATRVILEPDVASSMVRLHALLQFDPSVKSHIEQLWHRSVVTARLWLVGAAIVGAMLFLSVLFAVLKIDRATGGNARGRLALGVVGMTLLLAVTALLAVRMVGFQRLPGPVSSEVPTPTPTSSTAEFVVEPSALPAPQRADRPVAVRSAVGVLAIPVGLLSLTGLVSLLAYKKTRPIGLVILTLLVVGALVMIA